MMFEHEQEREQAEKAEKDVVEAYKRLFSTPDGRTVLMDLAIKFGWLTPIEGEAEEGMRRVVCRIARLSGVEANVYQMIGGK
jgi:hypothetical protein